MKKLLITFTIFALSFFGFNTQAFATNEIQQFGAVETNVLKDCGKKEGKEGIMCIIDLVIDILSVGVGIFGVIGISIVGIQYLTAGGSEEKTRKAKRRMLEIVIGLAAYAVLYAVAQFLFAVPAGGGNSGGGGTTVNENGHSHRSGKSNP